MRRRGAKEVETAPAGVDSSRGGSAAGMPAGEMVVGLGVLSDYTSVSRGECRTVSSKYSRAGFLLRLLRSSVRVQMMQNVLRTSYT